MIRIRDVRLDDMGQVQLWRNAQREMLRTPERKFWEGQYHCSVYLNFDRGDYGEYKERLKEGQ